MKVFSFLGLAGTCFALSFFGACSGVTVDKTPIAVANHWNSLSAPPWGGVILGPDGKTEFVFEGIAVKDYEYKRYTELIRRSVSWSGFVVQIDSIGFNAA